MAQKDIGHLPAFDGDSELVNIVVEASKGMCMKLKYDEKEHVLRAEKALPVGLVFPFDFGFVPSTKAEDGDPLDVLVLSEAGIPFGCVVLGELIGVLECEQIENGETERNDRVIAIPIDAKSREPMLPVIPLDKRLTRAITEFFVKYNELQGKKFRVLGVHGPERALELVKKSIKSAKGNGKRKKVLAARRRAWRPGPARSRRGIGERHGARD
jgi:inorganic pyrophosphatase